MPRAVFFFVLSFLISSFVQAQSSLDQLPGISPDTIRVFLVRHAETYHNVETGMTPADERYYKTTEKGEKQAQAIGELLKDQPIVAAFSSETERTMETLKLSSLPQVKNVEPLSDPAFNRVATGLKEDGSPGTFNWRVELWSQGIDPRPNEGESMQDACKRFISRIRKMDDAFGKAVVVVTHGDILAGVVGSAKAVQPWERWGTLGPELPTGSVSVVDITKDQPLSLRAMNVPYELK